MSSNIPTSDYSANENKYPNYNIEEKKPSTFIQKVRHYFGFSTQKMNIQTINGIFKVKIEKFSKKELEKQKGTDNSISKQPELGFIDKYIRGFHTVKLGDNYIKIQKKSFLKKFEPKTEQEKRILKYKGENEYIDFKIKQTSTAIRLKNLETKNNDQKEILCGMDLAQVQEKYLDLKSQNLVPNLDSNTIEKMFQIELRKGDELIHKLEGMLIDIGINELPKEEMDKLIILLLISNISNQTDKDFVTREILSSFIQIAKKNNSQYEIDALNAKKEFLNQFDFSEQDQSSFVLSLNNFQITDLIYLQKIHQRTGSPLLKIINLEMHNALKEQCLNQFKLLCGELKNPGALEDEIVLKKSLSLMAILNFLSKDMPVDNQHEKAWADLFYAFKDVLNIKKTSKSLSVREQLDKAFDQYQTLIEDGFVAYKMKVHGGSAEHVTKFLYGRTDEELENLKSRNREKVAEKLLEFSDYVKKGNPITIEMLATLHGTNNRGIVPQYLSRLRKRKNENIQFGKRVGVIPKNVQPAVQEVLDVANALIKNPPKSQLLHSIQVAKLHNSLLDIHPFLDRNGSTSLLLMELLMTIRGDYTPPKNRIKNYNANLSKILKNKLAVAVVSYEHYKIAHQFGYYASKTIKVNKQTSEYYKNELEKQKLRYKSESITDFLKKLWSDFEKIYNNVK